MRRALATIVVAACGDQRAAPDGPLPTDCPCDAPLEIDAAIDAPIPPDRADVESIAAAATAILAGDRIGITVTLNRPAPGTGQAIAIAVGDESVLGAPSAVYADPGVTSVAFDVLGKRPARPTSLTATSGATSKSIAIGVGGLAIAELLTDPVGPDSGLEWVKISNATSVAIDLGAYSIGNGRTHYTYALTQLAGIVPPHGCFIVGGPISSPANGNPTYSQLFNLSPDLLTGSSETGQATGTALFDLPITAVATSSIPIDAVLCGINNSAGLVGTDGLPAVPGCPDISTGHSVARTGPTTWTDLAIPAPDSCNPF